MSRVPPIPERLVQLGAESSEAARWLARLPEAIAQVSTTWGLELGEPYTSASCSWVAPARLPGGEQCVLKIGLPHFEAEDELEGLLFWGGDPCVRVVAASVEYGAMLLERVLPGQSLRSFPGEEQDEVIAGLLRRLWRRPPPGHRFRSLAVMTAYWLEEAESDEEASHPRVNSGHGGVGPVADSHLHRLGRRLLTELPQSAAENTLLATDLHAGNVLASERYGWRVIDPKPFVGDPVYDGTQHLLDSSARLLEDPLGMVGRFAQLLAVDEERLRLWTFARLAAGPAPAGMEGRFSTLARALAP